MYCLSITEILDIGLQINHAGTWSCRYVAFLVRSAFSLAVVEISDEVLDIHAFGLSRRGGA
jgi:hypothetical protein